MPDVVPAATASNRFETAAPFADEMSIMTEPGTVPCTDRSVLAMAIKLANATTNDGQSNCV